MNIAELQPLLLVQSGGEVLKVSTIRSGTVTAEVVYPLQPRTTVREYTAEQVETNWKEPSKRMITNYERAWGVRT